jgi:hypothetical protein
VTESAYAPSGKEPVTDPDADSDTEGAEDSGDVD